MLAAARNPCGFAAHGEAISPNTTPFQFSPSLTGNALTLTIRSDTTYVSTMGEGAFVASFDLDLGFQTSLATYVATAAGAGYTALGNGAAAGTVSIGGFDSSGGNGQASGSVLATVTFALRGGTGTFPITYSGANLNNDVFSNGTAAPSVRASSEGRG